MNDGVVLKAVANGKTELQALHTFMNVAGIKDKVKVEVKLVTNADGKVTKIDNVVVTFAADADVSDLSKLNLVKNVKKIVFETQPVANQPLAIGQIKHVADLDIKGNTVTLLDIDNTTDAGTININGTGNIVTLKVNTPNATVKNNVATGTANVTAVAYNSFYQNAKADKIVWKMAAKADGTLPKLHVNAAVKNVVVEGNKAADIKGVAKITEELVVTGKANLDVAPDTTKPFNGKANVTIGGTATDEAKEQELQAAKDALDAAKTNASIKGVQTLTEVKALTDTVEATKTAGVLADIKALTTAINNKVSEAVSAKEALALKTDITNADNKYTSASFTAYESALALAKADNDETSIANIKARTNAIIAAEGRLVETVKPEDEVLTLGVTKAELANADDTKLTLTLTFDAATITEENKGLLEAGKEITLTVNGEEVVGKVKTAVTAGDKTSVVLTLTTGEVAANDVITAIADLTLEVADFSKANQVIEFDLTGLVDGKVTQAE